MNPSRRKAALNTFLPKENLHSDGVVFERLDT